MPTMQQTRIDRANLHMAFALEQYRETGDDQWWLTYIKWQIKLLQAQAR